MGSGSTRGRQRNVTTIIGRLSLSEQQGRRLGLKAWSQWSPHLERCCLLLSANESYDNTAQDNRHRIVNYACYQAEGISIGSGEIESTVKQIGRRMKISGAQGDEDNVQQVLHRWCAYLNGYFSR